MLFYDPLYFLAHPLEIFAFWQGGMSIHGGVLFVALFVWLWARKNRIEVLRFMDVAIIPIALGQTLGRIGNFINGELWGRVTDVPWAMAFPLSGDLLPRHPSQIYEMIYDIVIGCVLLLVYFRMVRRGERRDGFIFGLWLILYALARSIIELFRDPAYVIGPLTAGQLLSIPFLLVGVFFLVRALRRPALSTRSGLGVHIGHASHVAQDGHRGSEK